MGTFRLPVIWIIFYTWGSMDCFAQTWWRCNSGDEETSACFDKHFDGWGYYRSNPDWCLLGDSSLNTSSFEGCCGKNGSTKSKDIFTAYNNIIDYLDADIKSKLVHEIVLARNLDCSQIEQWGCQTISNGTYETNDTKSLNCSIKIQTDGTSREDNVTSGLNCLRYKNKVTCQIEGQSVLEKFKNCCGDDQSIFREVLPINFDHRAKIESDDLAEYKRVSASDVVYSCLNRNGRSYDITPICGQLTNSSHCWSGSDGRVWCHLEKKKKTIQWLGVKWNVIFWFKRCCGGGDKWRDKLASEVAPQEDIALTTKKKVPVIKVMTCTTTMATTSKPSSRPVQRVRSTTSKPGVTSTRESFRNRPHRGHY